MTGNLFLDSPDAYQPPPDLSDFLAAGEPPVCITFGSMVNREADRMDRMLQAALAQTGQRGILLTGWGGKKNAAPNPGLLYLESAPHDWLFPRCKMVIHHGGAGTTAASLRAGIPNITIPHGIDQWFWGRRVAAIGAGPAPLDLHKLSVDTLGAPISKVNEPGMIARAKEVGSLIRAEDGAGQAVRLIEIQAK